jgi:hypothetical protein
MKHQVSEGTGVYTHTDIDTHTHIFLLSFYYPGNYTNTISLQLHLSFFQLCETVVSNRHIMETNACSLDVCLF